MNRNSVSHKQKVFLGIVLFLFALILLGSICRFGNASSLYGLLPSGDIWELTESPQQYFPDTLFEYINGAAEAYLSYDFCELVVAQYKKKGTEETITVEIYDMRNKKNSFGIYSAERFIKSEFVSIGTQGYVEEGLLNFLIGRYYVKLLCFDCGEESESFLRIFSNEIVERTEEEAQFPALLESFPKEGHIPNSDKFILKNFMGYEFFHDGYVANYTLKDISFDCFLIEAGDSGEAQKMLDQYLRVKGSDRIQTIPLGYKVKDPYYSNIYIGRTNRFICGVMKIRDGFEDLGEKYLGLLSRSIQD